MTIKLGGQEWIASTEAAQLAGCTPHALAMRRYRAKGSGKYHPMHLSVGSETLYLASTFRAYVANGKK